MIDKKNYPISVLVDIETVLKYFYSIEYKYADMLEMKFNEVHLIEIKDKEKPSFRFVLSTPHQGQGADKKTYLKITRLPKSNTSLEETNVVLPVSEVVDQFITWVSILTKYASIDLNRTDMYEKEEERQFFDEFEITEPESDLKALPIESQFKVYALLEQLQTRLEIQAEAFPEVKEVINEVELLKNNIQNLPQSVVGKRVAKIKVKIKKIGIKFFLDVVDVTYKEAIKFALKGGIDSVHHLLS